MPSNSEMPSPSDLSLSTLSISFNAGSSSHKVVPEAADDAKLDVAQPLTLPALPTDILVLLNSFLSKVSSVCLGLTCKPLYSIHFSIRGKVKLMTYELPTYDQLWMRLNGERDCLDEDLCTRVILESRNLRVRSVKTRLKYDRGWMIGEAEGEARQSWMPGNMWFDPFLEKFQRLEVGEMIA